MNFKTLHLLCFNIVPLWWVFSLLWGISDVRGTDYWASGPEQLHYAFRCHFHFLSAVIRVCDLCSHPLLACRARHVGCMLHQLVRITGRYSSIMCVLLMLFYQCIYVLHYLCSLTLWYRSFAHIKGRIGWALHQAYGLRANAVTLCLSALCDSAQILISSVALLLCSIPCGNCRVPLS